MDEGKSFILGIEEAGANKEMQVETDPSRIQMGSWDYFKLRNKKKNVRSLDWFK